MEDKDLLIDFDHVKILAYEDLSDEQKKEVNTICLLYTSDAALDQSSAASDVYKRQVNTICESEGISLSEDMPEELYPDSLLNAESDDIE